jgi:hypothetical protein
MNTRLARVLLIVLVLLAAFSMTACGKSCDLCDNGNPADGGSVMDPNNPVQGAWHWLEQFRQPKPDWAK